MATYSSPPTPDLIPAVDSPEVSPDCIALVSEAGAPGHPTTLRPDTEVRLIDDTKIMLAALSPEGLLAEWRRRHPRLRNSALCAKDRLAQTVMQQFAALHHVDYRSGSAAALFGENFEGCLDGYLKENYHDRRPKGLQPCTRGQAIKLLGICQRMWGALQPIDVASLPLELRARIVSLMETRLIKCSVLQEITGFYGIYRWLYGDRRPDRDSAPAMQKIEDLLDVPRGTLTGLPALGYLDNVGIDAAETNRFGATSYGASLKEEGVFFRSRLHGHCFQSNLWPSGLQAEWPQVKASWTEEILVSGVVLRNECSTATIQARAYHAGCYFAFLVDSIGIAVTSLSFAWFAHAYYMAKYVLFERLHAANNIFNTRFDAVMELAFDLLAPRTGWVWRQHQFHARPEFAHLLADGYDIKGELIAAGDARFGRCAWGAIMKTNRPKLEGLKAAVAQRRHESAKKLSLDKTESIEGICDDEQPERFIAQLIECLAGVYRHANTPARKKSALRDVTLALVAAYGLLPAYGLARLGIDRQVILSPDHFRLRLTRFEAGFKGADGSAIFMDTVFTQEEFPLLFELVAAQVLARRAEMGGVEGVCLFQSLHNDRNATADALTRRMCNLTALYLSSVTTGFGFDGLTRILSEAQARADKPLAARQVRKRFAPPCLPMPDLTDLPQQQEAIVRRLNRLIGLNPKP